MTDELPPWAAKAIRTEVGDEPVTDFRVLKESPFSKIVVGYTPTQTVVAERGFFGAVAWRVSEAPAEPARTVMPPSRAAKAPARRYKGPTEVEERIEGIGPAYGKKLFHEGVDTVSELRAANADRLAEATGISPTLIAKWQEMGELQDINGIGKQYSELLVRAGVTSVQEVASSSPGELTHRLHKYQEGLETNVQRHPITESLVAEWIQEAKRIS